MESTGYPEKIRKNLNRSDTLFFLALPKIKRKKKNH